MFSSNYVQTLYDCLLRQVDHEDITRIRSREIIDIFPLLKTNINVTFFSDTVKARSFKLCFTITLLGVYIFIVGCCFIYLDFASRS